MRLFDGKKAAEKILEEIKTAIKRENLKPKLAVILVGEDEASKIYIKLKEEAAEKVGVGFELHKYEVRGDDAEILNQVQDDILGKIGELNGRSGINGIVVQLPLPAGLDRDKVVGAIDSCKDVDGFHAENKGLLLEGRSVFEPVLPTAVLAAIKDAYSVSSCHSEGEARRISSVSTGSFTGIQDDNKKLKGRKAVALVNSDIFGRVLGAVLEKESIKFDYIVRNICSVAGAEDKLREADIVITVCGCPNLVSGEMIRDGAVVIDGGIYRFKNGRVCGDTDRASVQERASFLTPVPGGLGPLVIALLLKNVYLAAKSRRITV